MARIDHETVDHKDVHAEQAKDQYGYAWIING
jgi:hypothetical protein